MGYVRFCLADRSEDIQVAVFSEELERLKNDVEPPCEGWDSPVFFIGESIDGKTFAVKLDELQAVRLVWESKPVEGTRCDGHCIKIYFKGRAPQVLSVHRDQLDQLWYLLDHLQTEKPGFKSVWNGCEQTMLNSAEIQYIEIPTAAIKRGWRQITEQDQG